MQAREPTSWRRKAPSNFPDRKRARRFLDPARTSFSLVGSKPHCLLATRQAPRRQDNNTVKMSGARGAAARDQIVKLIVGAGQASPSPPVGPALGSKGIKSMDFCKVRSLLNFWCGLLAQGRHANPQNSLLQEFNARTANINPGTPLPCRVTVRPDRSFHFDVRTPQTSWLLLNAAEAPIGKKQKRKGATKPGHEIIGTVSLKHVYEIAKIKQSELRLSGLTLEGLCRSIIYQSRSMGVNVVA